MSENRIKKAVIREDLLSITKDYRKAILLNQFIYWSERVSDADKFIQKENEIAKNNGVEEKDLFYGWIYKTAEELSEEVMLGLSASQIRRYINDLVDLGYLSKRNNPKYKWDRTFQYRVNLVNIAKDLKKNGFPLSDYRIEIPDDKNTITHQCAINNASMDNQSQASEDAIPENTNRDYNIEKEHTVSKDTGEVHTVVSERNNVSREKPIEKYLLLKDKETDMLKRVLKISLKNYDEETANEIFLTIEYFLMRYTQRTGKIHPILKDDTLERIIDTMARFEDCEYGHYEKVIREPGIFREIVDEYFNTDFGAINGGETNYRLPHFVSDEILSRIAQRVVEY